MNNQVSINNKYSDTTPTHQNEGTLLSRFKDEITLMDFLNNKCYKMSQEHRRTNAKLCPHYIRYL